MPRASVPVKQIVITVIACAVVLIALYYLAAHFFAEPQGVDRIIAGRERAQKIASFGRMPYGDYGMVVYAKDRLYLGSSDDAAPLICLSPLGRILWKKKVAAESIWSIARAPNGGLYVQLSGGTVIALSADGTQRWSYVPDEPVWSGELSTDAAGNVYFDDNVGRIYAVGADGMLRWTAKQDSRQGERSQIVDLSEGMLPLEHRPIIGDDCVFQTCYGTTAYALDGEILWHRADGEHVVAWLPEPYGLAIACGHRRKSDDEWEDGVVAIDMHGELAWEAYYQNSYIPFFPAVGADCKIYVPFVQADLAGHKTFGMLALSADGQKKWFFETPSWCLGEPTAAADGSVWFASRSRATSYKADRICHVSRGGELIKSYSFPDGTVGSDLSPDGVLYVMGLNEALYAISP